MVIMIRLSAQGKPYQLGVIILLMWPGCASPADWTVQPRIQLTTSYTNNVTLAPAGSSHDAWIAEIIPALSLAHDSPRLRLALDYRLDLQQRSGDDQRSTQLLDAALHGVAVPEWLVIDASAAINQQSISPFGAQSEDLRLQPANRRSVRTLSVSPAVRHRFPGMATVELLHRRQQVTSGALFHVCRQESSVLLSGDQTGAGWNWSASAESSLVQDRQLPDVRASNYAISLSDRLSSLWLLFATQGRERYDYQSVASAPEGRFHTIGLDWTPSPRSRLKASAGRRYFGNTYALAAEYRWRHLYWSLDLDETISTSQGELLRIAPTGLSDFLDQLWASRIPDRNTRLQAIKVFLLISQMLGPDGRFNFLSHRYFLQKTWRTALLYASPRNTFAVSLINQARTAQTNSAIDSPITGPDQLAVSDSTRQRGAQAGWSWRLSPQSTLSVGASLQQATALQTGRRDHNAGLTLAYTQQLGRASSLSVDLRHLRHSSNTGASYREAGIGATYSLGY